MAVRTAASLREEALITKEPEKSFLKMCALMVENFDENYLRSEMQQILDILKTYRDLDQETLKYNGTSADIAVQIKQYIKKLKPFKTVLY